MYYSIHGTTGNTVYVDNGYGILTLIDFYDFPGLDWPTDFSTALNDIGNLAIASGDCHTFYIRINIIESFYNYIPVPWPGYYIKYGSTGSDVVKIQNRLTSLGFNCGYADGIFGNLTKTSVISFQKSRGIVGPVTWDYFFKQSFEE